MRILFFFVFARGNSSSFYYLFLKGGMASTLSCVQLHKRAERVAQMALETGKLSSGDRIALVFQPGTRLRLIINNKFSPGVSPLTPQRVVSFSFAFVPFSLLDVHLLSPTLSLATDHRSSLICVPQTSPFFGSLSSTNHPVPFLPPRKPTYCPHVCPFHVCFQPCIA